MQDLLDEDMQFLIKENLMTDLIDLNYLVEKNDEHM